jgi:hypothetical protein
MGTITTTTSTGKAVILEAATLAGWPAVYATVDLGAGPERLLVRDGWCKDPYYQGREGVRIYPRAENGTEVLLTIPKADWDRARAEAEGLIESLSGPIPDVLPAGWRWEAGSTAGVGGPRYLPDSVGSGTQLAVSVSRATTAGDLDTLRHLFGVVVARRGADALIRPLTDAEWEAERAGLWKHRDDASGWLSGGILPNPMTPVRRRAEG